MYRYNTAQGNELTSSKHQIFQKSFKRLKNSNTEKGQHLVMENVRKILAAFGRAIKCEQKSQKPSWVEWADEVTPWRIRICKQNVQQAKQRRWQ